jgi:hypothetical protein
MEGAKHHSCDRKVMKDASSQDESFEGGFATRRKLSRSADTLRV